MNSIRNRLLAGICMLLFVISVCVPFPAGADDRKGTLSLWCVQDEEIVSGMHWQIYRVGHREDNDYVFEAPFDGYRPTLGDQSVSMLEWDADTVASVAETLRVYAIIDKLPVRSEGVTDAQGNLQFTDLEDGLYLVIGDTLKLETKTYIPSAVFFEMNGEEKAYLNAFPKIILETQNEQTAEYTVKKVWMNDKNQPPDLSTYIICELYRDGELYETVQLDASNGWYYKWSDESGHEWLVREKVIPKDYTVVYKSNQTQYLIINTYEPPHNDSSITDEPPSTTTTDDEASDVQTTTSTVSTSTTMPESGTTLQSSSERPPTETTTVTTTVVTSTEPPKLPQTGQLWWPVPLLCGGGLTLIAAGMWIRRKDDQS